jgi:hypothetical protein
MGRRLAEATKAWRTRRTRGEIGLRFFFVLVEATGFFLAGADLVDALFVDALFDDAAFAGALLVGPAFAGALSAGAPFAAGDELDWATAGCEKPSQSRKEIPAKNATAKRRTQTLPTAGSWHP